MNEVRLLAIEIYKKHKLNSWILALICALFIAALSLVGIVSEGLVLAFIPFVILPFFFACAVSHAALSEKDELTFSTLFGFYRLFFRVPFLSSFSSIRSFLKAFLADIVLGVIATWIIYAIFSRSETFVATLNQVIEAMNTNSLTEELYASFLEANNDELNHFMHIINTTSFLILSYSYIFFIIKEEITIYIRLQLKNIPLSHQISRACIKTNWKSYHAKYFALNWPMLVLLAVGMVGGVLLSILVFNNYSFASAIGLSMGVGLTLFFLPFYFSNMEAIYRYLGVDLAKFSQEYLERVFTQFNGNIPIKKPEDIDGKKKDSDDPKS